jgi:hypothetical protein
MRCLALSVLASVACLSACRTTGTPRPTIPATAVPAHATAPNTTGPWVTTVPLMQRVTVASDAVVSISGDGGARVDTMTTALSASFTWASRAHRRVDGTLSEYRLGVGSAAPTPLPGLTLPHPFNAEGVDGALTLRYPAEANACTDPAHSVLQTMHDAWIPLPDTLVVGREWSDTVHTLSCRERVLLRGTSVRRFRVVRGEVTDGSKLVVLIDRIARSRLTGNGEQFGEPVSLMGDGTSTLRYVFDVATGRVMRAEGTSALAVNFTSARRKQRVQQDARITIAWLP